MSTEEIVSSIDLGSIRADVEKVLRELVQAGNVKPGQLLVIGTSTSEVLGRHIGTAGSGEAAAEIFAGVEAARVEFGFYPVFQCCEHLNRALVLEQEAMERYGLEQVSVVPVPKAGGSMAAFAYRQLPSAVVVETVHAHAGIDIGGTLIGMHLKRVAVPFKPSIRRVGEASLQAAYTRPKLIGGVRAVYSLDTTPGKSDTCE